MISFLLSLITILNSFYYVNKRAGSKLSKKVNVAQRLTAPVLWAVKCFPCLLKTLTPQWDDSNKQHKGLGLNFLWNSTKHAKALNCLIFTYFTDWTCYSPLNCRLKEGNIAFVKQVSGLVFVSSGRRTPGKPWRYFGHTRQQASTLSNICISVIPVPKPLKLRQLILLSTYCNQMDLNIVTGLLQLLLLKKTPEKSDGSVVRSPQVYFTKISFLYPLPSLFPNSNGKHLLQIP